MENTIDTTKSYSFYELITENEFVIEVPKVQRDYVQGRDSERAQRILEQLLKDIKKALMPEEAPLQLQFVYGKAENGRFIPMDGQQRLTTLFLLHVYAFRNDASMDEVLKRFSYETRPTSREFVQKLVLHRAELFQEMDNAVKADLKDIITDSAWFNSLAIYDPTVLAMMNALAMIYKEFHDYEDLDVKLKDNENKKVVFHFLNMNSLGMEDSLYIKLNARGKQLTKFENFKASLFEKLENISAYSLEEKNEILSKFDNSWTDIFWQLCEGRIDNFDKVFERFFSVLLRNEGILLPKDEKDENDETDIDILDIDLPENGSKIGKEFFDTLKYLLDYLADGSNKGTAAYTEIYNRTIKCLGKEKVIYEDRIFSHMTTCFIREAKGDVNTYLNSYGCWSRVLRNLIHNTRIDKEEGRQKAVNSINHLAKYWNNLYEYLQDEQNPVSFFETRQVEEERRKIAIILAEENASKTDFTNEIYEAEKQQYFKGQIRSALYRAYDENNKSYDIVKFKNYWKMIELLFEEMRPRNGVNLCRALLCYGDYRKKVSAYKTLCVDVVNDSARTPSMKTLFSKALFSDVNNENTESEKIVTALLDELILRNPKDEAQMEAALCDIIAQKQSTIAQNDWRWCLVNYSGYNKLFEFMQRRRMRNDNHYGEELLIRRTSASGLNPNIFLMVIGNEIGVDATDSENYQVKGVGELHSLDFYSHKFKKWMDIVEYRGKVEIRDYVTSAVVQTFSGGTMIEDAVKYCKSI